MTTKNTMLGEWNKHPEHILTNFEVHHSDHIFSESCIFENAPEIDGHLDPASQTLGRVAGVRPRITTIGLGPAPQLLHTTPYHAIPSYTKQYMFSMQYHTMQQSCQGAGTLGYSLLLYHTIPYNAMQYHAKCTIPHSAISVLSGSRHTGIRGPAIPCYTMLYILLYILFAIPYKLILYISLVRELVHWDTRCCPCCCPCNTMLVLFAIACKTML